MLKQVFNKDQLLKVLTPKDVSYWGLLPLYGDIETAAEKTVEYWKSTNLSTQPLKKHRVSGKIVYTPARSEDALSIKLLDRFIRRIYKVRQSDRNRIVKQLITLLKDSTDTNLIRIDIKNCYESIPLENLINKFSDELILAPECIKLLKNINNNLKTNHSQTGLARGLSISPTLAELYLERLDTAIMTHDDIIYSARYVDDIIVITSSKKQHEVIKHIENSVNDLGLSISKNPKKKYIGPTNTAEFNYLGYAFKVRARKNRPNQVEVKISDAKIKKIKSRIAISLYSHKKQRNFPLLKRRLEYISMLKIVKKGKNGDLLAGIANNYQHVTDDFECLKKIDGFLCHHTRNPRFSLTKKEQEKIRKISIYGNARKKNIGKFSNKQTIQIMRAWKNA